MRKIAIMLTLLVALVLVVVAVRMVGTRNETSRVAPQDATRIAREASDDPTAESTGGDVDPGLRPEPGTYRYAGTGSERVTLLGGSKHTYPSTIAAVAALDSKDECAWSFTLVYVEEHVERQRRCTTSEGMQDRGFARTIKFFGTTQRTTYECDEDAMRVRVAARAGETWSWTCHVGTDSTAEYTGKLVGIEPVTIDDETVRAHHMHVTTKLTGDTTGSDVSDYWFAPSGLLLRFELRLDTDTKSILGQTKYIERASYRLESLTPEPEG